MTEFAGMAYYAEVPMVLWDVQRIGPSTGLPTRTSQADLTFVNFLGHGDTQSVILLPGNVNECFEFGWRSFDLAERLQTPVYVLSDLDMGMNQWMSKPFQYPDQPMDRGKVLWEKDIEELKGNWGRYLDKDGDGIPYRTVPGNKNPMSAYFTRGTGHDENARYTEDSDIFLRNMERLKKKYDGARKLVPAPQIHNRKGATIGIVAYGSTEPAILEAMHQIESEHGIKADFMRIRAVPFSDDVRKFIEKYDDIFVVELNREGQLNQLLRLEYPHRSMNLRSVEMGDGMPASARWVRESLLGKFKADNAKAKPKAKLTAGNPKPKKAADTSPKSIKSPAKKTSSRKKLRVKE
jgi:2-oxoglutarate ferredoxin oxidoreductase subunit alpha